MRFCGPDGRFSRRSRPKPMASSCSYEVLTQRYARPWSASSHPPPSVCASRSMRCPRPVKPCWKISSGERASARYTSTIGSTGCAATCAAGSTHDNRKAMRNRFIGASSRLQDDFVDVVARAAVSVMVVAGDAVACRHREQQRPVQGLPARPVEVEAVVERIHLAVVELEVHRVAAVGTERSFDVAGAHLHHATIREAL